MVSNEVASLEPGEARPALLLTPKSRIVAPLRVVRERPEAFLLITEAELAETVAARRCCAPASRRSARSSSSRIAATCSSARARGSATTTTASRPFESWGEDEREAAEPAASSSALRIEAGTPVWGRELDETILPAEAGLDETHVSFTKGCYPGQEPIARLHYRGRPNRRLRGARGRCREPGRRDRPRRARPSAASRAPSRAAPSATSGERCRRRRAPDRRRGGAATLAPPRARSSGDRALPCGGRGRKFESCRAHRRIHGRCHDSSGEGGICVVPRTSSRMKATSSM